MGPAYSNFLVLTVLALLHFIAILRALCSCCCQKCGLILVESLVILITAMLLTPIFEFTEPLEDEINTLTAKLFQKRYYDYFLDYSDIYPWGKEKFSDKVLIIVVSSLEF